MSQYHCHILSSSKDGLVGEKDHLYHAQNSTLENSSTLLFARAHSHYISYHIPLGTSGRTLMTNNLLPSSGKVDGIYIT
jgi:hypothetical protein